MTGVQLSILLGAIEFGMQVTLCLVVLLRRRYDPTVRLSWLLVILLLPIIGALAYVLFGEARLGAGRIKRHREVVLRRARQAMEPSLTSDIWHPTIPDPYGQIALLAERVGGDMPCSGNRLQLFGQTEEVLDAMLEDIRRATNHVHLETYIYLTDHTGTRIAQAMMEAEKRGVECRVLADGVGSRAFLVSSLAHKMRNAGVQVEAALPVRLLRATLFDRFDLRNHRKITVIDGRVGYTGSQNIADASFAPKRRFAPWVDTTVRIEGPAVRTLQLIFCEDWFLDTDEWLESTLPDVDMLTARAVEGSIVQCIGTGPNVQNLAARGVFHAATHLAREEIVITNPYFVPDDATASALATAAQRGVTTTMILPARNDSRLVAAASRSYYGALLEAGVNIHEYQPGLLHAKTMTIDRNLAVVTSANLDRRSLFLNFEAGLIVYDSDFASELRLLQMSYLNDSTQIDPQVWERRRWHRRLWENTAGLVSPLL